MKRYMIHIGFVGLLFYRGSTDTHEVIREQVIFVDIKERYFMGNYTVLELPLIVEPWQKNELFKKMECARIIYNNMLSHNLKIYKEIVRTKEWRELNNVIREELSCAEKENNGKKKKSPRLKEAYDRKNAILREGGFSDFSFGSQAIQFSKYFQKHISSNMAALSIATPMWVAFEKLLFGNGERVSFKKSGELMSLASNNKSGIRFVCVDGNYRVILSNRKAGARTLSLVVKTPKMLYEKELLSGDLKKTVKITRIINKKIKNKDVFYVQLTLAKDTPVKYFDDGTEKHPLSTGMVGVAVWRDELWAVGDNSIYRASLIPSDEAMFLEKREELSRQMEYLRRIANPQNFNEDGTIKKGIIGSDGHKHRLKWYYSGNYNRVKTELRELFRIHDKQKQLLRDKIVWDLLSMGNEFFFADTSFLTKKPEWDEENPLSNTEYKKKKERRKAIQSFAPSALLTKLSQRLEGIEGGMMEKKNIPEELYWYQHDKGISDKELFAGDKLLVSNEVVPHTAYRAFLIRHFDTAISKVYDQKTLNLEFDDFIENLKEMM